MYIVYNKALSNDDLLTTVGLETDALLCELTQWLHQGKELCNGNLMRLRFVYQN